MIHNLCCVVMLPLETDILAFIVFLLPLRWLLKEIPVTHVGEGFKSWTWLNEAFFI